MKKRLPYAPRTMASPWSAPFAAATTIAARMPILFSAAFTGSPRAMREVHRMVSEKAAAAAAGAVAAGQAWASFWLRGSGLSGPADLAAIFDAAIAPAHRICKANARRLAGRRKRRRR